MDEVLEDIFPKMIIQMANKHKKIVITEMHIKATRGGHFTSTRMAIIKETDNDSVGLGRREIGRWVHCWQDCKMVQLFWKTFWQISKKLNTKILCDPAIPLLVLKPRELKTHVHTKTCT